MITLWLKRILKYTFLLLLIILLAIVGWVGYYYVKEVRPYIPIIENILATADPENRHPPKNVVAMVDAHFWCSPEMKERMPCNASHNKDSLVARLVALPLNERRQLSWALHHAVVSLTLVKYGLTEEEKNALLSELLHTGYFDKSAKDLQSGLNVYAKHRFGKPLSQLTLEEAAELVAKTYSPSAMKDPQRLEERTNHLLKKYKMMHNTPNIKH